MWEHRFIFPGVIGATSVHRILWPWGLQSVMQILMGFILSPSFLFAGNKSPQILKITFFHIGPESLLFVSLQTCYCFPSLTRGDEIQHVWSQVAQALPEQNPEYLPLHPKSRSGYAQIGTRFILWVVAIMLCLKMRKKRRELEKRTVTLKQIMSRKQYYGEIWFNEVEERILEKYQL